MCSFGLRFFSDMRRKSHGFAGMDGVETMGCANMGK